MPIWQVRVLVSCDQKQDQKITKKNCKKQIKVRPEVNHFREKSGTKAIVHHFGKTGCSVSFEVNQLPVN